MKATTTSAIALAAAPDCFIPAFADPQLPGFPFGIEPAGMIRQPSNAPPVHLTPRQLEVLALLCVGLSNKLIGRRLNIAGTTVKIHISSILRALNVSSRLQAVVAARPLGLSGEPAIGSSVPPEFSPPQQSVVLHFPWDDLSSRSPAEPADESLLETTG
jgi:DNA-binding NarL/FixJ family response regulator